MGDIKMSKSQILLMKWNPNLHFTVNVYSSQCNMAAYTIGITEAIIV